MEEGISEDPEFLKNSESFVYWFTQASGTRLNPKVQLTDLRSTGAGRGAIALERIEEDEELFTIPKSLIITSSSIPTSIVEPLQGAGGWQALIVTIIYEYLRGEVSSWYHYLRVLPKTFNSLMFWSAKELAELQASAVVSKIGKSEAEEAWNDNIIPLMLVSYPDLFPVQGKDEDEKRTKIVRLAHMAGSLIMAYAFDIDKDDYSGDKVGDDEYEEDDEDDPVKGMVPFADMLNADADRNNARLFQEEDCLIMKSTKAIPKGDEIFNDYGPLPRSDLLRMYGYVTENYAKYDVVEFSHSMLEEIAGKSKFSNSKAWQVRKDALDELGILDDGYIVSRPSQQSTLEDAIPGQIHMLVRALCLEEKETKIPKINSNESFTIDEVALLSAVFTKRLCEYPTTVSEDQTTLSKLRSGQHEIVPSGVSSYRYKMAVEVRKGEKEILETLIRLCQDYIREKTADIATRSTKRKYEGDTTTNSARTAKISEKRQK